MELAQHLEQQFAHHASAIEKLTDAAGDLAINLIVAVAILLVTLWASGWASAVARRFISRFPQTRDDATLQSFIGSAARYGVVVVGAVAILHRLGVETTSIITILGAASIAVGLALQGALSNVAAGVMILIFRPYRVGDVVTLAGKTGTVKKLDLFNTELIDADGVKVVAPNAKGFSDVVVNYTDIPNRRIELSFSVRYEDDVELAREVLRQVCREEPRLLGEPAHWVNVTELGASSVMVTVRVWTTLEAYWDTRFDLMRRSRQALNAAGLHHAYPAQIAVDAPSSPEGK
jgi:small conductance mechanosensitive channel